MLRLGSMRAPASLPPLLVTAAVVAALNGAVYLTASAGFGGSAGFPLDDSWIHQTFARNLATLGQMAVNPGEPVSASTSPAWTLVLAVGYLLGMPPQLWPALLGWALLVALARETTLLARTVFPGRGNLHWWAGILTIAEWRLVWAAFSGMETLLFTVVTLALLRHAAVTSVRGRALLGAGAGLLFLVRPEGAILGALAGGIQLLDFKRRWRSFVVYVLAAGAVALPFVLFNLAVGGRPLPAAFYAKNAGYASPVDVLNLLAYLQGAAVELSHGPVILLVPGLMFGLARRFPGAPPGWALPLLWAGCLLAAYMIWLPVLYHHGRYLMPLLPIVVIYGLHGSGLLLNALGRRRLLGATARTALALLWIVGWGRGVQIFAGNTRWVNQQQVQAALWLRDHTPASAVVGTHDIGALSYFAGRPLVDIAGLATKELVDSPKDVDRVMVTLTRSGVTYLAVFPDWYPPLYDRLRADPGVTVVHQGVAVDEFGGSRLPMQVLKWDWAPGR